MLSRKQTSAKFKYKYTVRLRYIIFRNLRLKNEREYIRRLKFTKKRHPFEQNNTSTRGAQPIKGRRHRLLDLTSAFIIHSCLLV